MMVALVATSVMVTPTEAVADDSYSVPISITTAEFTTPQAAAAAAGTQWSAAATVVVNAQQWPYYASDIDPQMVTPLIGHQRQAYDPETDTWVTMYSVTVNGGVTFTNPFNN